MPKRIPKAALMTAAISLVLIVIGGFFWIENIFYKTNTALNDYTTWGIAIVAFLFLEALTAGSLIAAGFTKEPALRMKLAAFGVAAGLGATTIILADLGSPFNSLALFLTPEVFVPMKLDVIFLSIAIVGGTLFFFLVHAEKEKAANILGKALVAVCVMLLMGTTLMFTSLTGKLAWHSTLEIATAVASAVLAGACIALLLKKTDKPIILTAITALLIIIGIMLADVAQALFTSTSAESASFFEMLAGPHAVLFGLWVVLFLIVPLTLFVTRKQLGLAATLSVVGIFISKYLFITKGNQLVFESHASHLQIPYLGTGASGLVTAPLYVPTLQECLVVVGSIAVVGLIVALAWTLFFRTDTEI